MSGWAASHEQLMLPEGVVIRAVWNFPEFLLTVRLGFSFAIVHPVKQNIEHEAVTEQTNRDQSYHKHSHRTVLRKWRARYSTPSRYWYAETLGDWSRPL